MPIVTAGAIELHYDADGDPARPTILLVMGLATQSIAWPDSFVDRLVGAGFHVVRYDNRDVGVSTHFDGAPAISPVWALLASGSACASRLLTHSPTWRPTGSPCSMRSASNARMSSARRWAA